MAKTSTYKMTITVFEIQPEVQSTNTINLPKKLFEILDLSSSAKDRLMPLSSENDNKDSDFISSFNYKQNYLFGSFARLNAGEETIVRLESLDKKIIELNEMIQSAQEDSAGSLRQSAFFCMQGNLLVMSSARENRKAFEVYTNWLLREKGNSENACKFTPKTNIAKTIPLKDIQSIKISDSYLKTQSNTKSETYNLSKEILKSFLDVKNVGDFNYEDIISATLLLKIDKRELKKNNAAALDTALRIIDNDQIVITGKNNKTIRGSEFLITAARSFERSKTDYYNEKAIETEMRNIIKAVKNGEVVS